jgi:hypothetical protein
LIDWSVAAAAAAAAAVLAHHLMILSLLALKDYTIPFWSLGRGHPIKYGARGGSLGVARRILEISVIHNHIICVFRMLHIYYRMERPWGQYDPTLVFLKCVSCTLPAAQLSGTKALLMSHNELKGSGMYLDTDLPDMHILHIYVCGPVPKLLQIICLNVDMT